MIRGSRAMMAVLSAAGKGGSCPCYYRGQGRIAVDVGGDDCRSLDWA